MRIFKDQKLELKWESEAVEVLKEKIEKREKLGFKNDFKLKYFKDRLQAKQPLIGTLQKVVKVLKRKEKKQMETVLNALVKKDGS